ncbi:hypothetical protein PARHAE_03282 [Paracoccus haematequi]|uniref:Uncharacterized protein n=1 Tax=Paracoccus haematequi TaxID=2491866 RepID=A0A447IRF3_9RHOB|nr:hypothetical protein [Paracoccus haematequi]VDS10071.1 hypothetical protein PARHAE_03282 [Paracoccus haematequi]
MDMIATLRAEQSALRARLQEIDQLLEEYAKWEARVASVFGPHGAPNQVSPEATQVPQEATTERPITPIAEFEKAVLEVLGTAESPRNRTDLLSDLEAAGIVVGGSDPRNTLSARLTRMPQIINLKGHGYWLKDRPYEPAMYFGADDLLTEREPEPPVMSLGIAPDETPGTSQGVEQGSNPITAAFREFLEKRDDDDLL